MVMFLLGLLVGTCVGMLGVAMFVAAGQADDEADRIAARVLGAPADHSGGVSK